jgi:Cd2+/Zn2+-exporting ATPase
MNKKQKMILTRIIISFLLMIIIFVMNLSNTLNFVFYFVTYLIIGYDIIIKAFKGVLNLQAFDENFLMTIATIGVFVLALISNESDCFEAVAVMFFFQVGELFEGVAVRKSRKSIAELMDIRPDYANIEVDGKLKKVSPEEINI